MIVVCPPGDEPEPKVAVEEGLVILDYAGTGHRGRWC